MAGLGQAEAAGGFFVDVCWAAYYGGGGRGRVRAHGEARGGRGVRGPGRLPAAGTAATCREAGMGALSLCASVRITCALHSAAARVHFRGVGSSQAVVCVL